MLVIFTKNYLPYKFDVFEDDGLTIDNSFRQQFANSRLTTDTMIQMLESSKVRSIIRGELRAILKSELELLLSKNPNSKTISKTISKEKLREFADVILKPKEKDEFF